MFLKVSELLLFFLPRVNQALIAIFIVGMAGNEFHWLLMLADWFIKWSFTPSLSQSLSKLVSFLLRENKTSRHEDLDRVAPHLL